MKMVLFFGFCFFAYWLFLLGNAKKSILEDYFKNNYFGLSPKIVQMLNETVETMRKNGLNEKQCYKSFAICVNVLMILCVVLGLACFIGMFLVV